MKKLLTVLLLSFLFVQCKKQNDIKISEKVANDLIYHYEANFPKSRTDEVRSILSSHLKDSGMSFENAELDADLGLNNGMNFYIKSKPGNLEITFDRKKNSEKNYQIIKEMCGEISKVFN